MIHGTSIKIFLADGTPDGFKVVEKSNWTGKAIVCSRAQFPSVKKHEVFSRTGVYLLIGTDDSNDLPKAYIGEGDPVLQRLESHERNKEFWETMIVFTSKDQNLNKAHIQYIESRLVEIARAAKRCILDNGNSPTQPALSEAEVADIEAFLSEMRLVYSVLGVKIFDIPEVTSEVALDSAILQLKSDSEVIATGQDKPEGFIVMKGSHCLKKESPSFSAKTMYLTHLHKPPTLFWDDPRTEELNGSFPTERLLKNFKKTKVKNDVTVRFISYRLTVILI
jgi:hypothetical protein